MNPLVVSISSSVALLPLFGLLSSQRLQIIFPADPAEGTTWLVENYILCVEMTYGGRWAPAVHHYLREIS